MRTMTGSRELTEEQRRRVQARFKELLRDMKQNQLEQLTGIKQPTISAAERVAKVGYKTAEKLARYLDIPTEDLLNGTERAGHYASNEMKYPKRGRVLDGLRRVIPAEVLDEVQAIDLPDDAPDWTELDWLEEVLSRAKHLQRLQKLPQVGPALTLVRSGQPKKE